MPSRDIGLNHGSNGKGDVDRTIDRAAYSAGYKRICWGDEPQCFERRGTRLVKTYRPAPAITIFTGILR